MKFVKRVLLALGLPIVLVALWWVTSANSFNYYFPPLSKTLDWFGKLWFSARFADDVVPSLVRLLAGFALSAVIGVALGVALGLTDALRRGAEPVLEFVRAIPPTVLVPVIALVAGIGDGAKILVIVSGCVWPVLLNTVEGVRAADEVMVDTARSFRFTWVARLRHLVLPAASPQIAAGLRQSLSIGLILMVIGEMFAATDGLGFSIVQFQRTFAIPQMWSGIILLGLIGFVLSALFSLIEKRALGWYLGLREAQKRNG
ncbi:ABC transporter permease [Amycolatopsis acidicola]|uniref:ABC transporter permease n=1 Tax=Amycolatopsis acidicola TaxID=2596893 RepID=A0A5N0VGZ6_9PSEU|nr:ABC transporter permease [Amycolatopsis acidicola]KAA9165496.1 ABC transporter permease [Amycolatopsis acidicola]